VVQSTNVDMAGVSPSFLAVHRKRRGRAFKQALLSVAGFGVPIVVCLWLLIRFDSDWAVVLLTPLAIGLICSLASSLNEFLALRHVRIAPYFSREVDGERMYMGGEILYRLSGALDDMSAELGSEPISSFVSGDDWEDEQLSWHHAPRGLEALAPLLDNWQTFRGPAEQADALREWLDKLRKRLETAAATDVDFCLLVLVGTLSSGYEIDRRKGRF